MERRIFIHSPLRNGLRVPSRHGKVVGVFLSKDRIEAPVESMELLSAPDFIPALEEHKAGRGNIVPEGPATIAQRFNVGNQRPQHDKSRRDG
ncbi:MAG: hypothetical protein NT154_38635 [Verrucomicrobia bacterium]|nr:hypothetical protein [Verrucomicrobiota bacterium]